VWIVEFDSFNKWQILRVWFDKPEQRGNDCTSCTRMYTTIAYAYKNDKIIANSNNMDS
jgi:type IV secretory pathway component VirB8